MKRTNYIIRRIFLIVIGLCGLLPSKAEEMEPVHYMDSVEFSLITCSPHDEVYSLYGHSALRYHDLHQDTQEDIVFNWGVFNYNKPFFVLRFVFGLTDYELGIADFQPFCKFYQRWGCSVTEQVLNLTTEEKERLKSALADNYRPENRVYRYNYFYDNCSTRPRDMIERCVSGKVIYYPREDFEPSFRRMVSQKTAQYPWATFGNDMLLGVKSDLETNRKEQEFLPENLLYDFDHAQIKCNDGMLKPLVKERRIAVQSGIQFIEPGFPLTPLACGLILLALSLIVFAFEWKRRKTYKYWDVMLMLLTGLAGCVLFVMIFSQHPTTTLNLQLLLINPVHLFYIPTIWKRRKSRYWQVLVGMVLLFMIGSIFQHFAEGVIFLALCLLIRYWSHVRNEK